MVAGPKEAAPLARWLRPTAMRGVRWEGASSPDVLSRNTLHMTGVVRLNSHSPALDDKQSSRELEQRVADLEGVHDNQVSLLAHRHSIIVSEAHDLGCSAGAHVQDELLVVWGAELRSVRQKQPDLERISCAERRESITNVVGRKCD